MYTYIELQVYMYTYMAKYTYRNVYEFLGIRNQYTVTRIILLEAIIVP